MVLECEIAKHLVKKIPKSKMTYRPYNKMRSTLELLRDMSFCGTGCARIVALDSFKTNDWAKYEIAAKKSEKMKPGQFIKSMDAQIKDIKKLFASIPESDLARKKIKLPMGGTMTMGQALLTLAFRFMSGYRMQLFCYAKGSGNTKISTSNCWFGKDSKS
jgi:hypothetical protein